MASEDTVDLDAIADALGWDFGDVEFRIRMAESVGTLLLMVHWLRGIVYSMVFSGAVKLSPTWLENFKVLYQSIDRHEAFLWEVAPPRGVLMQLRVLRRQGYLDEDWEKLLQGDAWGRVPRPDEDDPDTDAQEILHRMIGQDNKETPHDAHRLGG